METLLVVLALILFPATGVCIYLYLQSTFQLLKLVQNDPALWRSLGRPRKIHVREAAPGGFQTIQPIGPWLAWVWAAQPAPDASAPLAERLRATSRLLKRGLLLFAATLGVVASLALSGG